MFFTEMMSLVFIQATVETDVKDASLMKKTMASAEFAALSDKAARLLLESLYIE